MSSTLLVSFVLLLVISETGTSTQAFVISGMNAKIASIYNPVSAKAVDGRNAISLLKGIKSDFLVWGFWKWGGEPYGMWALLPYAVGQTKAALPNLVFGGAMSLGHLARDYWANGTLVSQTAFQDMLGKDAAGKPVPYMGGYAPDLASSTYREYVLGWSKKFVDAGVDSLVYDTPFLFAWYKIYVMGYNSASVQTEYAGYIKGLLNQLKAYAASRGRQILVSLHLNLAEPSFQNSALPLLTALADVQDFATVSFRSADFYPPYIPQDNWSNVEALLSTKGRFVPIVALIDWDVSNPKVGMILFASLTTSDQIAILSTLDASTKAAGVLFAYPVWGPDADTNGTKYDSVKYGTFDTMASLAAGQSLTMQPIATYSLNLTIQLATPRTAVVLIEVTAGPNTVATNSLVLTSSNPKVTITFSGLRSGQYTATVLASGSQAQTKQVTLPPSTMLVIIV